MSATEKPLNLKHEAFESNVSNAMELAVEGLRESMGILEARTTYALTRINSASAILKSVHDKHQNDSGTVCRCEPCTAFKVLNAVVKE